MTAKVRWHRVLNGVSMERAFDVDADGSISNGRRVYLRGQRTSYAWVESHLTEEFPTQDAYEAHLRMRGFTPGPAPKTTRAPSFRTMERWVSNGVAKAVDGCTVEPDGTCSHGAKSWLLVVGAI